ncbi:MAG: beta-N-acetylhexosaminidase [Hyphomicrobiaceae bacterium]|nr:beta-N-acetylhexosaminidase [Hyphomicrobiaceae bacterium]
MGSIAHKAFICGCSGPDLTDNERAFLRDERPCGLILFARNCVSREQITRLTDGVRECAGDDVLVLVDQEGGRVQRMGEPEWRAYPPARAFATLYGSDRDEALAAVRLVTRLMADDLREVGINTDCAPVLDVPVSGAHEIIGDRSYGDDPETIIVLARAMAESLLAGGVLPVIKHVPGHGRARADSHKELPVIDASREELEATDFRPFAALADMPLAMTAHVVLRAFDEDAPATVSRFIMTKVIREQLGIDGLVMSDDLDMAALSGKPGDRAQAVLAAGCDVVLHCSGVLEDMTRVAHVVPALDGDGEARFRAALDRLKPPSPYDREKALAMLDTMIGEVT